MIENIFSDNNIMTNNNIMQSFEDFEQSKQDYIKAVKKLQTARTQAQINKFNKEKENVMKYINRYREYQKESIDNYIEDQTTYKEVELQLKKVTKKYIASAKMADTAMNNFNSDQLIYEMGIIARELKRYEEIKREEKNAKKRGRKREQRQQMRDEGEEKEYTVNFVLYRKLEGRDLEKFYYALDNEDTKMMNKHFSNINRHYVFGDELENGRKTVYVSLWREITTQLTATQKIFNFSNKKTFSKDQKDFKYLLNLFKANEPTFNKYFLHVFPYIEMIWIKNITDQPQGQINIEDEPIHYELSDMKIFYEFVEYNYNVEANDFKDILQIQKNVEDLPNSCLYNYLYQYHKQIKNFTHDTLCDVLGIEKKENDIGISFNQAKKFFEKYRVGLVVYDRNQKIISSYTPEKFNKHLKPLTMYLLYDNMHVFQYNNKVSSVANRRIEKSLKIVPSAKYPFRDFEKEEKQKMIFVNEINEVVQHVKDNKAKEYIKFVLPCTNMKNLLFKMIDEYNYTPQIRSSSSMIDMIRFKVNNVNYSIITDVENDDTINIIDNKEYYKKYFKANRRFYNAVLNKANMSYTNEEIFEIERHYKIMPMTCIIEKTDKNLISLDRCKAYSSIFNMMEYFPVFSPFDNWKKYDNHSIEDYTQYIVIVSSDCMNGNDKILFNKQFSRCYGYKLRHLKSNYIVQMFRRPSVLNKSNIKDHLKLLYNNNELTENDKKFIVNCVTGLCEKSDNEISVSNVLLSMKDAILYKQNYGGHISMITPDDDDKKDILNIENDEYDVNSNVKTLYIHSLKEKKQLNETFKPIKDLIYDYMTVENYKLYCQLNDLNINVYGIKTDGVLIDENDFNKCRKNIEIINKHDFKEMYDTLGKIHVEKNKKLFGDMLVFEKNEMMDIKNSDVNMIMINDEFDIEGIKKNVQYPLCLNGKFPGTGKTYLSCKLGDKVLVVTPYNKLAQRLRKKGHKAITFNKLFGLHLDDDKETKVTINLSEFDTVVFDEIRLYDIERLRRIHRFMNENKQLRFIANGDMHQLLPIQVKEYSNIPNLREYITDCINILFPNQITLTINKRLKNSKDREIMEQLMADIFNLDLKPIDTLRKYGFQIINNLEELKTKNNICYFRRRAQNINDLLHTEITKHLKNCVMIGGIKYYKGMQLVGNAFIKNKEAEIHVNYSYVIDDIDFDDDDEEDEDNYITVRDEIDDEVHRIKIFRNGVNQIEKYFKFPYCNTCHSNQGMTIDSDITIFDVNIPYTDRNYIWTALTRVDDFKNVTIFEHSKEEVERLSKCKLKQYFMIKVENYKRQDKMTNRYTGENFVDVDHFYQMYKKQKHCSYCYDNFDLYLDEHNNVISNITLDRVCNLMEHTKDNVRLCCLHCNVTKK